MIVGEDLANGALVGIRHRAVGEDPVVLIEGGHAVGGLQRPRVVVGRVVEDEIEAETDPGRAQIPRKFREVLGRPKVRADIAIGRDRIPAVVIPVRHREKRHEVEVADPEVAQVGDLRAHPIEIACPPVDIGHRADHLLARVPSGVVLALVVEEVQLIRTLLPGDHQIACERAQLEQGVDPVAVHGKELPGQPGEVRVEASQEGRIQPVRAQQVRADEGSDGLVHTLILPAQPSSRQAPLGRAPYGICRKRAARICSSSSLGRGTSSGIWIAPFVVAIPSAARSSANSPTTPLEKG